MPVKCSRCGINAVFNPGDVCSVCLSGENVSNSQNAVSNQKRVKIPSSAPADEMISGGSKRKVLINGGAELKNTDPYGNNIAPAYNNYPQPPVPVNPQSQPAVKQSTKKQKPQKQSTNQTSANSSNPYVSDGIVKNITVDTRRKSFLSKWFNSLFSGVPFYAGNSVTKFQIFPNGSKNSMGNACDQVVVYGMLDPGDITDGMELEVYGKRNASNNIVARYFRSKASGSIINPAGAMGSGAVWGVTLFIAAFIAAVIVIFK